MHWTSRKSNNSTLVNLTPMLWSYIPLLQKDMFVVSAYKRGQTSSETSSFIKKENTTCFSFLSQVTVWKVKVDLFSSQATVWKVKVDFIMSKCERRYAFGKWRCECLQSIYPLQFLLGRRWWNISCCINQLLQLIEPCFSESISSSCKYNWNMCWDSLRLLNLSHFSTCPHFHWRGRIETEGLDMKTQTKR